MRPEVSAFWPIAEGVRLRVRALPGASREGIAGVEIAADGKAHLKIRVRAKAQDGRANLAVRDVLAATLGIARSRLVLESGDTQRLKIFTCLGDEREQARIMNFFNSINAWIGE